MRSWCKRKTAQASAQPIKCIEAAVIAMLLVLAGCARPVRIGMSGDYPPFAFRDAKGCLQGFDVDMAKAWSVEEDRIIQVVPFAWPELARDLAGGRFDLAMSGITVRGDRLIQAPMTRAVATADAIVVVRADRATPDIDSAAVRIAVNRGGHLERVARAHLPEATLVVVDDNLTLPDLLARGEVDAVVTDTLELRSFTPAPRVARVLQSDRKAYWVSSAQKGLLERIDQWLAAEQASGHLAEHRQRYMTEAPEVLSPAGERLADLVARRLQVMPFVAETKRSRTLLIEDSGREDAIRQRAMGAAESSGLESIAYVALVEAQFTAAKSVQRAHLQEAPGTLRIFSLTEQIRPAIDRIDRALRQELAARPSDLRATLLSRRIQEWAPLPGVNAATIDPVVAALLRVVAAPSPQASGGWFGGCPRDLSPRGIEDTAE